MDRCGQERSRTFALLLAFLLPAAIFFLILFHYRIVPFGSTTLLTSDLDGQYIEFMAEYRRILLGEGSLFYSWHAGLGMNFIALAAYYLASPFNLLLVLFSEEQLPLAVSLLTCLKLASSGAAFAWFIKGRSRGKAGLIPLFSACYALSAFALGYAFNIMWLDALIWLPLLCGSISRLITEKHRGMPLLTLLFALSFLSQFYTAWMTGAFCVIFFLGLMITNRIRIRELPGHLFRFGLCVGIAAGLSAFLLLPTYLVLKNNMGLMGQSFPTVSVNFPFTGLFKKFFAGSFDGIKDCLPHIYCGLPALIGMLLYFLSKEIPAREKTIRGLIGAFLLFSFWFRPLDFLWHAMDHPSWFPYRYAFVFIFWILWCAYEGFTRIRSKKAVIAASGICLFLLIASRFGENTNRNFLPLNLIFLCIYTLAATVLPDRFKTACLTMGCCIELLISGGMTTGNFARGYTRLGDYRDFRAHYQKLMHPLLPAGSDFYRMEKTESRNYNDPLGIGFPGVSHFSSTASLRQAEYLKRLGFNCYATWCTYEGSTAVTDALLRIRYEFGEHGKQDSLPAGPETWEHPAQFPLFWFAEEEFARYDLFDSKRDPISRQNDLLRLLGGSGSSDYYTEIPAKILLAENLKENTDSVYVKADPKKPAFLEIEILPEPGRSSYLFLPSASLNYNVYISDTHQAIHANRDYAPFPVCLDPWAETGKVTVRIETMTNTIKGNIMAYSLDTGRLEALCAALTASAPDIRRNGEAAFQLRAEPSGQDRLVVSSIPFDAGWTVRINGEKAPLKMIHNSVLGFYLPAGSTEAEISYRPYGWETGAAVSGFSLMLWAGLLLSKKRTAKGLGL